MATGTFTAERVDDDDRVQAPGTEPAGTAGEVLRVFLLLGLTSFGGPIAHLGYFQDALVQRRRWLGPAEYADIVALCQVLPGPTSSQVGLMIGRCRAGVAGAFAAWLGFTLPSALLMAAFAFGLDLFDTAAGAGVIRGLKDVAVAVVALAVWGMARTLWPDRVRATVGLLAATVILVWPAALAQLAVIAAAAILGVALFGRSAGTVSEATVPAARSGGRGAAGVCLAVFAGLLFALPLLGAAVGGRALGLLDGFYRSGALVFGGGHVVLPLLEAVTVPPGWVTPDQFTAGYGLAQAIPGPLFTFSAYLGAIADGGVGAIVALGAIFLPSFLLVFGIGPFWDAIRHRPAVGGALSAVNAAVVGILLAALYDPIWVSAIGQPADLALAVAALGALAWWSLPPWLVVLAGALVGIALAL